MLFTPEILPELIMAVKKVIHDNAEEVTTLDQILGDGDHVTNLQRGLDALEPLSDELSQTDWTQAWQKIGMTLLSTMGGASGSLLGTLFLSMNKASLQTDQLDQQTMTEILSQAVDAVKKRGKSDAGEKTMLDVWIPVIDSMKKDTESQLTGTTFFDNINQTAITGMEATREMLATKGRASYLQEKSIGHIDAGAKTSQLMICAVVDVLKNQSP